MRQGLEAYLVGDLADAQIRVEQEILCLLNARPRNEFRKGRARYLSEQFTEIEGAGVTRRRHLPEGKVFRVILLDELLRLSDDRRLGIGCLHRNLIALHREMVGEDG